MVKAKLLILTGADEPTVPLTRVKTFAEEMAKADADWQMVTYSGTKHGFTYPDAASRKIDWIEYNKSTMNVPGNLCNRSLRRSSTRSEPFTH
jgi:dienelactone hydrolase